MSKWRVLYTVIGRFGMVFFVMKSAGEGIKRQSNYQQQ
jgi:hypothetical protein